MLPELDIVIVNWNAGDQLRNCLESIVIATHSKIRLGRVVVVDNYSHDNSLDNIKTVIPHIHLIQNSVNRGFGAACNQGAAECSSEVVLFLNPDTALNRNSLLGALDFMKRPENSTIGILGIKLFDEKGRVSRDCANFPTPFTIIVKSLGLNKISPRLFQSYFMDYWDHESNREVDHVIGAFYMVRKFLFDSLDGFDERFFVYLEDLDFSLRAHHAGWRSYYLSDCNAYHKGGGVSNQIKAKRLFYSLNSRIVYVNKHFKKAPALLVSLCTLTIEPLVRLIRAAASLSATQIAEILYGYKMLFAQLAKRLKD